MESKKAESKSESKEAIVSSKPADVAELNAAPAARPNAPSIMSAPREKKVPTSLILIVALVLSVALNIFALFALISKIDQVKTLESELSDSRAYVEELKKKLNGEDS